jgi:hypothetical protein
MVLLLLDLVAACDRLEITSPFENFPSSRFDLFWTILAAPARYLGSFSWSIVLPDHSGNPREQTVCPKVGQIFRGLWGFCLSVVQKYAEASSESTDRSYFQRFSVSTVLEIRPEFKRTSKR